MATDSDVVLVVASRAWSNAWEGRGSPTRGAGAAAEASALRSLEAQDRDAFLRKVRIVVLPDSGDVGIIPTGLHGIPRFHLDSIDDKGLVDLLRDLTGQAEHPKPPLGRLPVLPPSVEGRLSPADGGRTLPPVGLPAPPLFAGQAAPSQVTELRYAQLAAPVPVLWRSDWDTSGSSETVVAVHATPVPPAPLPARALATVLSTLPDKLRQARALDPTSAVEPHDDVDGVALIFARDPRVLDRVRPGSARGVRVDKTGQVTAWHTLPADTLGSVVEPASLTEAIATCLRLIGLARMPSTELVALAVELGPTTLSSRADPGTLGTRSQAAMRVGRDQHVRVPPDETVDTSALGPNADSAAQALAALILRVYDRS